MLSKGISFVLLTLVSHAFGAAKKTSDIFQVNFNTDADGGCSYVGATAMDGFIEDCLTLAKAGVQLMNDYQSQGQDSAARRLVDSLFKTPSANNVASARSKVAENST
jgi:hypothetical protein